MSNRLKKVHEIQLEMALEVKRICEKNDINYIIIAGTLLGAVRHRGFIPWDDDLDIGMLREDYDKFIGSCNRELNDKYFLQTWETDPAFALPIAKIRRNGTRYVEQNSSQSNMHCGIYIDIFPFDSIPKFRIQRWLQDKITYFLKRALLMKKKYQVWSDNEHIKKIVYKIISLLSRCISDKKIKKNLYNTMTKYNHNYSERVVTFGGAYGYKKESIKREWLRLREDIAFEHVELSAPHDYSSYLTHLYGDYMTPPPENQRYNRHKIMEISFEEVK